MGRAKGHTGQQGRSEGRSVEVLHTRVFAASPKGGNPCPVIRSGDHLGVREMQALARRFGLDTVFVLSPQSKDADIRLRYFVPEHEMGVSGHATVAAITVAVLDSRLKSDSLRVETLNGVFAVTCMRSRNEILVTLEQNSPDFGPELPSSLVARALRIGAGKIAHGPIQSVSVSRPKLLVPLCDSTVLNALEPDFDTLWDLCDSVQVTGVYPFTRKTDKANADAEARQFPLRAGFPEDAATGVAAAALGAYLSRYDHLCQTGERCFRIAQGYAMGASSLIEAIANCESDKITRTAIRGTAEIIRRERVTLPDQEGGAEQACYPSPSTSI